MIRSRRRKDFDLPRPEAASAARLPRTSGTSPEPSTRQVARLLDETLGELGAPIGVYTASAHAPDQQARRMSMATLRRAGPAAQRDPSVSPMTLALVEDERGVLRVETTLGPQPAPLAGARARRAVVPGSDELLDLHFDPFPANQLSRVLRQFDESRFAQLEGLRAIARGPQGVLRVGPRVDTPVDVDDALVIVHGTASSVQHLLEEMGSTEESKSEWEWLGERAQNRRLYAFNHATLSVSPVLNAIDLADAVTTWLPKAKVDVVCHSRGGLVSRWWAEVLAARQTNQVGTIVFVGAPLDGTSLAAPAALKGYVEHLANTLRAVQTVSGLAGKLIPTLQPLAATIGILTRVLAGGLSVASKTPLLDVALAAIPGLAAMSRVVGNEELARLLGRAPQGLSRLQGQDWYHEHLRFVRADYEPADPGLRIWRYLTDNPIERAADGVVDRIFPGANDLVVDTDSMAYIRADEAFELDPANVLDFGKQNVVHHVNYFVQPAVGERVAAWLGA